MERKADLLIKAIKNKNVQQIKHYLEQGTITEERYLAHSKTLLAAVETQDLNVVKLLIEYLKNDCEFDWKNESILHHAVKQGNLDIIKYLLEQHPEESINKADSKSQTLLYIATQNKHIEVIKYLLKKGANINAFSTKYEETPLHISSSLGLLKITNLLLENKAEVNVFDIKERSPLHRAIINGHNEVAKVLIRSGTDLNYIDLSSRTVLYYAIRNAMIEVVDDLVQFGIDINLDEELIYLAIRTGSLEPVKILHKAGSSLTVKDKFGDTPLMKSCFYGQFSIAEYLLKNNVSPNVVNESNGMTALFYCCQTVRDLELFKKFLELLLEYNVDLEQSINGKNAFFYTVDTHNFTAACVLVKYGFDVNRIEEIWLRKSSKKHEFFKDDFFETLLKDWINLVTLVVYAGFDFKKLPVLKDTDGEILNFIWEYNANKPRPLQDLCRMKIRKLLGKKLKIKLDNLSIPEYIHEFLTLDILKM